MPPFVKLFAIINACVLIALALITIRWSLLLGETTKFLVRTPGCQILDLDPFHSSVLPLYTKTGPLVCSGPPSLVIHRGTTIYFQTHVWRQHYKAIYGKLSCSYRKITRSGRNNSDNRITTDRYRTPFIETVRLRNEFTEVNCRTRKGKVVYTEYIPVIQVKPDVERRCEDSNKRHNLNDVHLNVVFVGIDSVSRSNFVRHLPETYRYLKDVMGAIELKGYNKVGDNTFPNVVPLLTGRPLSHFYNDSLMSKPLDHIPFIWKNFSQNGYRTLFAEDAPQMATFNYMKKGFYYQPTDYYLRPFNLATENSRMREKSIEHCFNSKPEISVVLGWLRDFLEVFKTKAHWAYVFTSRLTHDVLNDAGYADSIHQHFLQDTFEHGFYNNSVLFVFSDHGIRFGKIRETWSGKLEERLPAFFIVVPEWFRNKYPDIWNNLVINQRRLTTPFDVYETLKDILHFTGTVKKTSSSGRGVSLFSEVGAERTCTDAGVPAHWCTCKVKTQLSADDARSQAAARALVVRINALIHTQRDKCRNLKLKAVLDVRFSSAVNEFLILIETVPGLGRFEGTVRYSRHSGTYEAMDDVSRINRYATQSWCVSAAGLQMFCFCYTNNSTRKKPP